MYIYTVVITFMFDISFINEHESFVFGKLKVIKECVLLAFPAFYLQMKKKIV